ncbi:MAG: hypothetical protein ACRD0D_08370 [Acidimicrobiales bacterium]
MRTVLLGPPPPDGCIADRVARTVRWSAGRGGGYAGVAVSPRLGWAVAEVVAGIAWPA